MSKMILKCIDNDIVHIECKKCGRKFVHLLSQPEPQCNCDESQPTGGSVTFKLEKKFGDNYAEAFSEGKPDKNKPVSQACPIIDDHICTKPETECDNCKMMYMVNNRKLIKEMDNVVSHIISYITPPLDSTELRVKSHDNLFLKYLKFKRSLDNLSGI